MFYIEAIPQLEVVFQSKEQVHQFNMPFQVGMEGDNPKVALTFKHQIKTNDIVIVGTDGLFDNLSVAKIADIVSNSFDKKQGILTELQALAQKIAKSAQKLSQNPMYDSPFSQKARKKGFPVRGGKEDDITCIVALIRCLN